MNVQVCTIYIEWQQNKMICTYEFVYLVYLYLFMHLLPYLSACLSIFLPNYLSIGLSVYLTQLPALSIYLSIYLSIHPSIYLFLSTCLCRRSHCMLLPCAACSVDVQEERVVSHGLAKEGSLVGWFRVHIQPWARRARGCISFSGPVVPTVVDRQQHDKTGGVVVPFPARHTLFSTFPGIRVAGSCFVNSWSAVGPAIPANALASKHAAFTFCLQHYLAKVELLCRCMA